MGRLPVVAGINVIKAFWKVGWRPVRQTGSHVIMMREGSDVTLSVPRHKVIKRGLLSALIKDAGLTAEEFNKLV